MDKILAVYDERDENYIYPHPGESEEDFEARMFRLQKKLGETMTEEDKYIAKLLREGKLPPIVEED